MSKTALDDFRSKLAQDEALREDLRKNVGVGEGDGIGLPMGALVEFAQARGYDISVDDLRTDDELGETELDHVSGGAVFGKIELDGKGDDMYADKWMVLSFKSFVTLR